MGNAPSKSNGPDRGGCCGFGGTGEKSNIKDIGAIHEGTEDTLNKRNQSQDSFSTEFNVATDSPMMYVSNVEPETDDQQSQMSESDSGSSGEDSCSSGEEGGDGEEEEEQEEEQEEGEEGEGEGDGKETGETGETGETEQQEERKGNNSTLANNGGQVTSANHADQDNDGDTNMTDVQESLACNETEPMHTENTLRNDTNETKGSLPSIPANNVVTTLFEPQYKSLRGHANWVEAVATYGTKIISAGVDEDIKIWGCSNNGTVECTMSGHDDVVTSVMVSNDGKHMVSGSVDKTVRIWSMETGKQESSMSGHTDAVTSVAYSKDDVYVVSGSIDNTMRLWNVFGGVYQCVKVFRGHTNAVDSVEYSPDGKSIISGSEDATLRIWDPKSGECINIIRGHTGWFYCVAHAPQRFGQPNYVCTGSHIGNVIDIWNVDTSKLHKTMKGHTGPVLSLAYSPNGQYIASGSVDHTVRVWHAETGACVAVLEGHTNIAGSVAFGSDGTHTIIVSGSRDHEVRLWYVNEIAPGYFNNADFKKIK